MTGAKRTTGVFWRRPLLPFWARLKADEGDNLIEYTLLFLVFIMIIFGIVDFGRALYSYHFVSNAAREATRWAAVNGAYCGDDSSCNGVNGMNNGPAQAGDVSNYVVGITPSGINSSGLTTTAVCGVKGTGACAGTPSNCSVANQSNFPGCTVEVQISYRFNFLTPLVSATPITLTSTSQMVIAH